MGTHYGPYVMYILSQLMQKRAESGQLSEGPATGGSEDMTGEKDSAVNAQITSGTEGCEFFTSDETEARWHREENLELLQHFCREGYAQARRHGHFLIGTSDERSFIAIPGRFLLEDQPAGGRTGFTLWQPLRGGETLYSGLEDMDEETARHVYGYWIAVLDSKTLEIHEV